MKGRTRRGRVGRGVLVVVLGIMRMRSAGRRHTWCMYTGRRDERTDLYWVLVIGVNSVVAVGASEQRLTLQNYGLHLDQYCESRDRRLCFQTLSQRYWVCLTFILTRKRYVVTVTLRDRHCMHGFFAWLSLDVDTLDSAGKGNGETDEADTTGGR